MATHLQDTAAPASQQFWQTLVQDAQWDIARAARRLHLSRRQFERLCQEHNHCTPRDYFHRVRMAEAARLLAAGLSVKVVAAQLGYTLPANLSRDFKRHHGRTPRIFAPRLLMVPPAASPVLGPQPRVK